MWIPALFFLSLLLTASGREEAAENDPAQPSQPCRALVRLLQFLKREAPVLLLGGSGGCFGKKMAVKESLDSLQLLKSLVSQLRPAQLSDSNSFHWVTADYRGRRSLSLG